MKDERLKQIVDDWQADTPVDADQTKQTIAQTLAQATTPKPLKRHHVWPWVSGLVVAALMALVVGGIYVRLINQVLAQAPIVGRWFAGLSQFDEQSRIVAEHSGVQPLNAKATDHGVTIKVTSGYVQGRTVAISGTINGLTSEQLADRQGATMMSVNILDAALQYKRTFVQWSKTKKATVYTFALKGTVAKTALQAPIHLPMQITSIGNRQGDWHLDMTLDPGTGTKKRKLTGVKKQGGYQIKVAGAEEYRGGTGVLKLSVTQPDPLSARRYSATKLTVNGGAKNYFVGAGISPTLDEKTNTINVQAGIRKLPKHVKTLTVHARLFDIQPEKTLPLATLPKTTKAAVGNLTYRFEQPTLQNNVVTMFYRVTGSGYTPRELANDHLDRLQLRPVNTALWDKAEAAQQKQDPPEPIVRQSTWLWDAKLHRFKTEWYLANTPLAGLSLPELKLQVPMNLQPLTTLKPITIKVSER